MRAGYVALNGTNYIPDSFPIGVERQPYRSLSTDAWAKLKTVHDESILHGMFTFNVPVTKWKESIDGVEQLSFVHASSVDGKLSLPSGALNERIKLDTYRNPRYEPNRGHLYASSIFLPNHGAAAQRTFGIFTEESGVGFRLRSGNLYGVIRTTVNSITTDNEYPITIPAGVDLSKGNTFDIQFQWRGVGDYYFFINQRIALAVGFLGTLTELSMFNPASPIAFESINQGEAVEILCGCVDVSSEGGKDNGKTYGSVSVNSNSGSVYVSAVPTSYNVPLVVARNKKTIGGQINTRDVLALLATAYADQKSVFRVWATRDEAAITLNGQVWSDFGDAHIEKIIYNLNPDGTPIAGSPIAFDTTKADLIFGCRVGIDVSYATSALFEGRTEIYQTPGDIFIFTMHRESGGSFSGGVTYEFAEAI